MTDITEDPRIRRDFRALADGAAVVGSVQIRNRATLAGQHRQRVAGGRHRAGAPRLRGDASSSPVRTGPGRSRSTTCFVRSGVTTLARGELITAIELPRPSAPTGAVHVRRTRRRGHDLASVTLACAVSADGVTRIALRQPRPAAAARRRRDGRPRGSGLVRRRQDGAARGLVHRREPVATVDAGEPRVPAGDGPRPRPAGRRHRDRAAGGAARGGAPA